MAELLKIGGLAVVSAIVAGGWSCGAWAQQKPAPAQPAQNAQPFRLDPNAPVDLKEDSLETRNGGCTLVLTGHVQVTQKQARLVGHSAIAVSPKKGNGCGDYQTVDVDKDVYYVTPNATVRADHALYDLTNDKVIFTGSVVLVRGDNVGTGARLVMDTKTNDYTMDGPVHAVLIPTPKPDDGSAPAASAKPATNSAQKPGKPGK